MGVIEEIHGDLEADVDVEEFREAVEERVERMGGLADEETAAMLVAHELDEPGGEVEGIAEIEAGMEEVKFVAKVVSVDELRTFERDSGGSGGDAAEEAGEDEASGEESGDEDGAERTGDGQATDDGAEEGKVLNAEVADETGQIRIAFWDHFAADAAERLERGDVLRIAGRPAEGFRGLEVNVDKAEPDDETEVDVDLDGTTEIEDLAMGRSDVNVLGRVLDVESVRTFDRDDGSEGKVANMALGDPTGRIRVTMWDGMADRVEELEAGTSVEIVDGYVREREGDLELHVGERGAIEKIDEEVEYTPESTPIEEVEIDDRVDLVGVVRSADPKRTFERDDGSEGQVRNVRIQDGTGDIRVALWGDKADLDVEPGDELAVADVEIQDGWQDDLEASAGWQSTVTVLEDGEGAAAAGGGGDGDADLSAFGGADDAGSGDDASGDGSGRQTGLDDAGSDSADAATSDGGATAAEATAGSASSGDTGADGAGGGAVVVEGESVEFTGTVVQAGDPIILDDGERTVTVEADADVHLGDEVTVRGRGVETDRIDAEDVF